MRGNEGASWSRPGEGPLLWHSAASQMWLGHSCPGRFVEKESNDRDCVAALVLVASDYGHAVFTLGNDPMLLLGSGVLGLAQVIGHKML